MDDLSLEREIEMYEFLRRNMSIEVTMDTEYECEREYVTCNASVRIRNPETEVWEDISSDYGSACVSSG